MELMIDGMMEAIGARMGGWGPGPLLDDIRAGLETYWEDKYAIYWDLAGIDEMIVDAGGDPEAYLPSKRLKIAELAMNNYSTNNTINNTISHAIDRLLTEEGDNLGA